MSRTSQLIWHYTTTAGLVGMLVNHRLWATSVSFVNDPTEQSFGHDAVSSSLGTLTKHADREIANAAQLLRSYLRHGVTTFSDRYSFSERMVACASKANDSLDMWRAYGAQGISGTYAIGLDPDVPLGPLFAEAQILEDWRSHWGEEGTMPAMRGGWTPMNYVSPAELKEHAQSQLLEGLSKLNLSLDWLENELEAWRLVDRVVADIEAGYKHDAYVGEHEVRLQATLTSRRQFHVLPKPQGVSAFLELTTSDDWGRPVSSASLLPVREVVVWPGAPNQALSGVAAALVRGGHNYSSDSFYADQSRPTVHIRNSAVPFV